MLVSVTPPYSCSMAEKGKNHFSAGEVLEAIFQYQDSYDEQFDCGSDVEMVEDSEESENDSDLCIIMMRCSFYVYLCTCTVA